MEQRKNQENPEQEQNRSSNRDTGKEVQGNKGLTPNEDDQDATTAQQKNKQGEMAEDEKTTRQQPNTQGDNRNSDQDSSKRNNNNSTQRQGSNR